MNESVFLRLENLLKERGVDFSVLRHQPVFTSKEAAAVRGVALSSGAKALICKVDDRFVMFVIPANRKLDNKPVRQALGIHALRFASREELKELTGLWRWQEGVLVCSERIKRHGPGQPVQSGVAGAVVQVEAEAQGGWSGALFVAARMTGPTSFHYTEIKTRF